MAQSLGIAMSRRRGRHDCFHRDSALFSISYSTIEGKTGARSMREPRGVTSLEPLPASPFRASCINISSDRLDEKSAIQSQTDTVPDDHVPRMANQGPPLDKSFTQLLQAWFVHPGPRQTPNTRTVAAQPRHIKARTGGSKWQMPGQTTRDRHPARTARALFEKVKQLIAQFALKY